MGHAKSLAGSENTFHMPFGPIVAVRMICSTEEPTTTNKKKPSRTGPTGILSFVFCTNHMQATSRTISECRTDTSADRPAARASRTRAHTECADAPDAIASVRLLANDTGAQSQNGAARASRFRRQWQRRRRRRPAAHRPPSTVQRRHWHSDSNCDETAHIFWLRRRSAAFGHVAVKLLL